jgi:hypothetical protein
VNAAAALAHPALDCPAKPLPACLPCSCCLGLDATSSLPISSATLQKTCFTRQAASLPVDGSCCLLATCRVVNPPLGDHLLAGLRSTCFCPRPLPALQRVVFDYSGMLVGPGNTGGFETSHPHARRWHGFARRARRSCCRPRLWMQPLPLPLPLPPPLILPLTLP